MLDQSNCVFEKRADTFVFSVKLYSCVFSEMEIKNKKEELKQGLSSCSLVAFVSFESVSGQL